MIVFTYEPDVTPVVARPNCTLPVAAFAVTWPEVPYTNVLGIELAVLKDACANVVAVFAWPYADVAYVLVAFA